MKVAAEELCPSMQSVFTGDLDALVKNLLTNDESLAGSDMPRKMGRPRVADESAGQGVIPQKIQTTPVDLDLVHSSCFGSSLTQNEDTAPLLLAGCKWRSLPLESAHVANYKAVTEPTTSPRASSPNTGRYSPSTSTKDSSENNSLGCSSHSIRGTQGSIHVTNSRKRRLSDSHSTGMSKRPRHSMVGSHLHTMQDPCPLSAVESEQTIDDWFKVNFDSLFALPPPAEVAEPNISTQWEVDLFSNYTLPENPQEAVTIPIPDYGTSSSTDLTALDDLLQLFPSDESITSPQIMHPPESTLAASTVSPLFSDHSQSIDWSTLFNGSFGYTSDSIFSPPFFNSTLLDIDISVLQVPQAWSTVVS